MGRSEKTKFIKSQIIRVAYNTVSDVIFHPTTVAPHRKPPSTRPKTRTTRRKCLEECSSKLKFNLHRSPLSNQSSLANASGELVLPASHSIIKEITNPKWMFDDEVGENIEAWNVNEKLKKQEATEREPGLSPPTWGEAPTSCPCRNIRNWRSHLWEVGTSHYHLQIPSSWSVFDNVDWMQDGSFQLASTDSESRGSTNTSSGSSGSPLESPRVSSRPTCSRITIACRGEHLTRPRGRGQWDTLATMVPHKFDWKYQTEERALRRNAARHTGYVDLNQHARNHDIWPQNSFPAVISHWEASQHRELLPAVYELKWPCMMGRWLVNVIETEMFPAQCEPQPIWPKSLTTDQATPNVDYICRATPQSIGWRSDMCPVLFAAQHDPDVDHAIHDRYLTARKLTSVFQPMMAILILYYLDTRVSTDDPMPPWMVLFGIQYNESGVIIRLHSPLFQPTVLSRVGVKRGGWRAMSSIVNPRHRWDMLGLPCYRGPLLTTLNRIQGHCAYVLDRLKAWEGYERACQLLAA